MMSEKTDDRRAELDEIALVLRRCEDAVVLTHEYPDGDAIGSLLAAGMMLAESGIESVCSWPHPFELPPRYGFMPGRERLVPPENVPSKGPLLIALDCADLGRLGELGEVVNGFDHVVNIDHHYENGMFGTLNYVSSESASTTEILFHLCAVMGIDIDRDLATCLYVGLLTDTGRFQYENTREATLRIAADLVGRGVVPHRIYKEIYQNESLEYLQLVGRILETIQMDPDIGLVYAILRQKDLEDTGVSMIETEDTIDILRSLRGHRVAALFKELKNGDIKVSLRSAHDVDVFSIAKDFGGGGHRLAAGYTSRESAETSVNELKRAIREHERRSAG